MSQLETTCHRTLKRFVHLCATVTLALMFNSTSVSSEQVELFVEIQKLARPEGPDLRYGRTGISIDGDRVAIGADYDDDNSALSGAVYLFERQPSGAWQPVSKLTASDGAAYDYFGRSVSLDGNRIAIGAFGNDDGAAYIFERSPDGVWKEITKIVPLDLYEDKFGLTVALDGDRVAISVEDSSDEGFVDIFELDPHRNWDRVTTLESGGGSFYSFGRAIELKGDRVVVGTDEVTDGAAYVFDRNSDETWDLAAKLTADSPLAKKFGSELSLDGERLVASAKDWDTYPTTVGLAYLFERDTEGTWLQVEAFTANSSVLGHNVLVDLDGNRLALSSVEEEERCGYVHIFEEDAGGNWTLATQLAPDATDGIELFGEGLDLEGDRLVAGARSNVHDVDTAYIFESVVVSPQLTVTGSCPGEVLLTATGVTPRHRIGLYGAESIGVWAPEAGPCAGTELDLDSPTPLRQEITDYDANGALLRIVRTVDASQCGRYLQLLDERTCLTSEVVQVPER